MRLREFLAATHLPDRVVIEMLSGNAISMSVDNDGFLSIQLSADSVKTFLQQLPEISEQVIQENFTAQLEEEEYMRVAERVIREEVGDIMDEVIERVIKK